MQQGEFGYSSCAGPPLPRAGVGGAREGVLDVLALRDRNSEIVILARLASKTLGASKLGGN